MQAWDPTKPLLEIENLSISFFTRMGEIPAVMDFSCKVMAGEAMGLVGESGCGKSTVALGLMRDLGANGKITGGRILFKGQDLVTLPARALQKLRGSEIAMIYQEPMASLNPAMKIGAQLAEVPMIHQGVSKRAALARARQMVEDVRLPDPERILNAFPHQLSGGQQQRIVIAMALMAEPALLILDEPTTALDVTVEAGIMDLLQDLARRSGTTMLFISHNLGLVLRACNRICVMYSGEAVETGNIAELFRAMRHPYTEALFRAIPLPGTDRNTRPLLAIPGNFPLPHERPPGCNFGPRCAYFQKGRCDAQEIAMQRLPGDDDPHLTRCLRWAEIDWDAPAEALPSREKRPPGALVLQAEDLRKYYQSSSGAFGGGSSRIVKANESLSFEARAGETLAIVGESGCGKSTLAKILLGLETASAGRMRLFGEDLGDVPIRARDRASIARVQMVFQNPFDTLNPSMTVGRQIIRALEVFGIGQDDRAREARMLELLDLVKLPRAFASRRPRQLSGGQKQRVGIARAFAGGAKLVVADEPVSALDVSVQAAVTELLSDIQDQNGTTLLFISHDLSIVRYLSDRVLVMYLGHVVEMGTTDQVFAPPYHPYTEALLSAVPVADPDVIQERIVLKGEIPSALNPPRGCPFQTRCHRKSEVPGNLCETSLPRMQSPAPGHQLKCHLSAETLAGMRPVIRLNGG
ncbi:dipeptide ABC transporter ATP-binding protein [Pseudogemmobacter faecipullorum]|uniref:Nickel import system ATP-binding protein NikD n=1 Tax=Pseudogemmobacter faecipullorum TaxID=2755041 RepID=A0ABS8CK61_9RHOB|nr:ABC transporter ATP-binding protein [Pseudogemmobacter faecipullorum]MCB5409782.1 ABC transporter ATP-binding protein [Pseudogemmobacter faecipullorum]